MTVATKQTVSQGPKRPRAGKAAGKVGKDVVLSRADEFSAVQAGYEGSWCDIGRGLSVMQLPGERQQRITHIILVDPREHIQPALQVN